MTWYLWTWTSLLTGKQFPSTRENVFGFSVVSNRPLSKYDIKIQHNSESWRTQRKLWKHVYSFSLFAFSSSTTTTKKKNDIMENLLPMFSNVLCHFYYLAVTQRPISNRCTGHSNVFTKTFFGKYLTWLMFQNSFEGDVFSILLRITYHLVIKVQIRRAVSTAVSIVGPQHLIGNNFNVHWNHNKGK